MTIETRKLFEAALRLPERERADLAGKLLESLEPDAGDDPAEVEAAWNEEIKRRLEEADSPNAEPSIPWEVVRREMRERAAARDKD